TGKGRARIATRVCQLEPDQEIVSTTEPFTVCVNEPGAKIGQIRESLGGEHELVWVRAAVMSDGDRFAAPDDLRAALSEVRPSPPCEVGWAAFRRAVPALHREDAPPVPGGEPRGSVRKRCSERRGAAGRQRRFETESQTQRVETRAKGISGL